MEKVFFTADLHFGSSRTIKYLTDRPYSGDADCRRHDSWLMDLWQKSVSKDDSVYILGDMCSYDAPAARAILEMLPGHKTLITGNHDCAVRYCSDLLDSVKVMCNTHFRSLQFPFLAHTLRIAMCHYPMLTWQGKNCGAVMLHGHSHGKMDMVNSICPDLRWDVGLDGSLSRLIGESNGNGFALVDLESLYKAVTDKVGGTGIRQYVRNCYNNPQTPEMISALQCANYLGH